MCDKFLRKARKNRHYITRSFFKNFINCESDMKSQRGFTLVELMTVTVTIGILAGISMQTFKEYRSKAYYGVSIATLRDARTSAEAGIVPDVTLNSVSYSQTSPGSVSDANARDLLTGFQMPKNVKFEVDYDPDCADSGCQSLFLQVRHCYANEYSNYTRYGDGVELNLEHIDGAGCP